MPETSAAKCNVNASECVPNADQMLHECDIKVLQMLANILIDIDLLHQQSKMDAQVFGAIVSLVAWRMDHIATRSSLNAD